MENQTQYTRCPTCSTAFKVTDKLLAMAAGKVRCGACLAIFQATDYMLAPSKKSQNLLQSQLSDEQQSTSDEVTPQPSEQSTTDQPTTIDVQQPLNIEQPAESDSVAVSDQLAAEQVSEQTVTNQETQDIQPDDIQQDPVQEKSDEPAEVVSDTELGIEPEIEPEIEHEIKSEMDAEIGSALDFDPLEFDNSDLNRLDEQDSEIDEMAFEDPEINESPVEEEVFDEQPFDELTTIELAAEQNQQQESADDQLIDSEQPAELLDDGFAEDDEVLIDEPAFDETTFDEPVIDDETDFLDGTDYIDETEDFNDQESTEELSNQLNEQMQDTDSEPDPLDEFDDIVEENNNSLKIKLAIASLLIILGIAFTSIWTNRQAIAWSDNWGGTMISVCQYLPCDLKPQRDVSKIKLLQRQLSPDEELENVLDVKVLLINEAAFDQPYPTIKIAFSNKSGERVSVKSYTPADYLDKQALNDLMPAGSEVHIHFKTEVTHPDALGFEFIFE